MAFGSDGTLLVTTGDDGTAVWVIDSALADNYPPEFAYSASFDPNGTHLVTGGNAGAAVLRIWERTAMRRELERRLGARTFEPDECAAYRIEPWEPDDQIDEP